MKLLWLTNFQRNSHGSNLRASYELLKRIVKIDQNLEIDILGYMPNPFNKTSKSKMTNLGNICTIHRIDKNEEPIDKIISYIKSNIVDIIVIFNNVFLTSQIAFLLF